MRTVRDFGAMGDGVVDDTDAIRHAIDQNAGEIVFPPGDYRITSTIDIPLRERGRIGISGSHGTAKIVMAGAGPALRILGSHGGTADPGGFDPGVWEKERFTVVSGIEIEGAHPEADGIQVDGAMQTTFEGVLLRNLRHGIHLVNRARNVLVSHCHIYDNSGIGVFLDHVNLHQMIVSASHISYCKQSGIKILNGQVRNIQMTGNDIEYNYDQAAGEDAAPSAEIWIETTDDNATIREGTISGSTIQSRYSPGGANIYFKGGPAGDNTKAGMFAITGNLIGSQETNVRIESSQSITLTGNMIYSGHKRNLHIKDSRGIIASANNFDHNPGYLPKELATGIRVEDSTDCILSGCTVRDAYAGVHTVETPATLEREGLIELRGCARTTVSGCQILDAAKDAIHVVGGRAVTLNGNTILDSRESPMMRHAIAWQGPGSANVVQGNTMSAGVAETMAFAGEAGVVQRNNTIAE